MTELSRDLAVARDAQFVTAERSAALTTPDFIAAVRALPYGGIDDAALNLRLSPQIRASISPLGNSLRWAAVVYGMIFGAKAVFAGSFEVVLTLTVCLFLTCWRTVLPLKLGSLSKTDRAVSVTDTLILGLAVGASGGPSSPYVFCVLAAVTLAAFGWGYVVGLVALATGWVAMWLGAVIGAENGFQLNASVAPILGSMVVAALLAAYARSRLLESEVRRHRMAGRIETLSETNDLLTMLTTVARTLPTSLNQREALDAARLQLMTTFRANVVCLMELDESHDEWIPKLAEGCVLRPSTSTDDLPPHLRQAVDSDGPWLVSNLKDGAIRGIAPGSGSGIYTKLTARGRTVGVVGIEHQLVDQYRDRDRVLLAGLADMLALTLDNARWFGRLRSLGAEEERIRIARDLHDRLGQWLTYISFELERIIATDGQSYPELDQLYADVQTALDELRETLRQLRSGISDGRPLAKMGKELTGRFAERTDVAVDFHVVNPKENLSIPVENELFRILQEALNNIDKHAKASRVDVWWDVRDGVGTLTIRDDGRGFDAAQGVRDSAYGLVGMRERADVIGGRLSIVSSVGEGTTITVTAGTLSPKKED